MSCNHRVCAEVTRKHVGWGRKIGDTTIPVVIPSLGHLEASWVTSMFYAVYARGLLSSNTNDFRTSSLALYQQSRPDAFIATNAPERCIQPFAAMFGSNPRILRLSTTPQGIRICILHVHKYTGLRKKRRDTEKERLRAQEEVKDN